MLWRVTRFLKKMAYKHTFDTYILDDNHYIIIESAWSNIDTYYHVCRYYHTMVSGESQGNILNIYSKKALAKYIANNKLRTPTDEEMKKLLQDKKYRVRADLEPGELEDTTLTPEEEKFLETMRPS